MDKNLPALWSALPAFPSSEDEFDDWAERTIIAAIAVDAEVRLRVGRILHYALLWRGESGHSQIVSRLTEALAVSVPTLGVWRRAAEKHDDLPPASPRAVAHQTSGLFARAEPPISAPTSAKTPRAAREEEPERVPAAEIEHVPPPPPIVVPKPATRPSTQLAFDWEPTSRRLATVLPKVPVEHEDDLADYVERRLQHWAAAATRSRDVAPMFKKTGR